MKLFKVDFKTNQKSKQLSWFIDNYAEIYNQDIINLYFYQLTSYKDLYFKSSRIKTYVFQSLTSNLSIQDIRELENFSYIVSLFTGRFSSNPNTAFMGNLLKIKDKSKIVCLINIQDYKSIEALIKDIQDYKNFGFSNLAFINLTPLYTGSLKQINFFCQSNNLNQIQIDSNYNYIIDESGNLINPKNKSIISNIYKYPGYLLFGN